ncbi:type II secretion system F family protein [Rhodopila sp.]|uniref:type II secretion system F family protein n=1 Tax=Rhodopila sp. TaxID=2480087 RepID=UPI003D1143EE
MNPTLAYLMAGASVCLVGLFMSYLLLARDHRLARQRSQRIEGIASAHRLSRSDGTQRGHRLGLQRQGASLASRGAKLLRYDPSHRAIYPVKLIVVLLAAVPPAALFARIVVEFLGTAGWLALPGAWTLICRAFYGWCEDRHVSTLFKQFPDALAMIVRAVRVGLPMVEALKVVARESPEPTAAEFVGLVAQTSIGVSLEDALREMAERNRLPEYRFFATALSLQSQTGGGLAETLENLADTIRKRLAARLRGHALAAEARMSSYILGALPVVTGILLVLTNPSYIGVLFTDPTGRNLLLTAIALLSVGGFIMRSMIRKSLT